MVAAINSSAVKISKFFLLLPWVMPERYRTLPTIFDIRNLLFREGVSQDIFRQGFLPVPVVRGDGVSGMHAETAVMPGHEFFNKPVVYPALSLQHGQDLGAEDLFELFQFSFGQTMEGTVRSKEPICQELTVVFEINAQHDRNAEDELSNPTTIVMS